MKDIDERNFRIPFRGLKNKVHQFEFELGKQFFEDFEHTLVEECTINVHLTFNKSSEPYVIDFDINGTFKSACDKCLANIDVPITGSYRIYVEFNNRAENKEGEEVIFIDNEQDFISVKNLIYDFVNLSLPIIKSCDDPFKTQYCDMEVSKYIRESDEIVEKKEEEHDPRWDQLKKLKY